MDTQRTNPAPASLVEKFKELGFNLCSYSEIPDVPWTIINEEHTFHTLDQLRDWLWEKHGLHIPVFQITKQKFAYWIQDSNDTIIVSLISEPLYDHPSLALTDALGKACEIIKERKEK